MNARAFLPFLIAAAGILIPFVPAFAFGPACCLCQKARCEVDVGVEEVDVNGFDVKCERICIPPLRFPWECGPLKKCGKVRYVNQLVEDKTTTKVCTYEWKAIVCCPSCRSKIRHQCGHERAGIRSEPVAAKTSDEGLPGMIDEQCSHPALFVSEISATLYNAVEQAEPDSEGWVRLDRHGCPGVAR